MAIAKVQFKANASATPEVWMDTTQKTVEAGKLLSGETALKNDGTNVVGSIASKSSSDLTASGATVTAPAGYYAQAASKSVTSGTAGTPTATKGAVSNHAVTVTPSVTNTTGYISGGTKNGTAVTVSVAELESGTKTITENGTGISVSGYSAVDVNVAGGSITVQPLSVNTNGTYTAPSGSAYSPVTVNVEGGGGSAEKKQVNFVDYDGTILYSYTASEANALTALPSNPSHAGLVAQGWNWTLAQIKSQLTAQPDAPVWVGQMYITQSGATEIDVTMTAPDLHPYLGIAVNGTVTIDWGDNTTADTVTGTSNTTLVFTGHEYAAAGNYTISISVVSGRFTFYNGDVTYGSVLSETTAFNRSGRYKNRIAAIRMGENAYIEKGAFSCCFSRFSITIPDGVTSIGNSAFGSCYPLISITIPDSVTSIGNEAFSGCRSLTSVTIPDGVTSIGTYAFQDCSSLTGITIPDGVTSIGNYAFYNCYTLTGITIPNGVTSIGAATLSGCNSLISVTIPDSVTKIGNYAFQNCYALTDITIPDGVTSIGNYAFTSCRSLTGITIPDGITSIGTYAFQNCYTLTSITIPDGVKSIGICAFQYCYGIREMHFKRTTPPTVSNSNTFQNAFATGATIYVPTGCLAAYTSATNYPSSSTYTYVEE